MQSANASLKKEFFSLLRFEFGEKLTDKDFKNINTTTFAGLYKLSKQHDLSHLIGDALDKNGLLEQGSKAREKFLSERDLAVLRYEQGKHEFINVCKALNQSDVQFIPLKGSVIRDYYNEPWMRTSADIDILVHKEDIDKATKILTENLQYTKLCESGHDVEFVAPSNVHLELHFALMQTNEKYQSVLDRVWEYAICDEGNRFRLADEMFYFHHIAHMAKHFKSGGCGVRSVLDCWVLIQTEKYSSDKVYKLLNDGGLYRFDSAIRKVASVWFGGEKADLLDEKVENYILYSGMYGDVDNRAAVNQAKHGGKSRYLLSRVFIPFWQLKLQFPILEKHKWLMPFCQVARWFRLMFGKKSDLAKKELKANVNVSNEKVKDVKDLLKNLDL